ncbi:MAG: hypothetical protein RL138_932 [Bacteroidota bacterium]
MFKIFAMLIQQFTSSIKHPEWKELVSPARAIHAQLVLVFTTPSKAKDESILSFIREKYPTAHIMGCSTSGEIANGIIEEAGVVVTAIEFEHTKLEKHSVNLSGAADSTRVGEALVNQFTQEGLRHILVLSEGLHINGTQLVEGMRSILPKEVNVTGGLAGDGADFVQTYVIDGEQGAAGNRVIGLGFYGDKIKIGYGSYGGWDIFGVERLVTRSENNVLYEIDNMPALSLYKSFLGDLANQLPASGLLFPLSLRTNNVDEPIVRTILAVDDEKQSLTFAGDIPEGSYVKLMKANVDHLIDGANQAAERAKKGFSEEIEFALLVSCVGRKLVMKQMTEEEIEAVHEVVGKDAVLTGFYSYGEISPSKIGTPCYLHNQSMTITTFSEK